MEKIKWKWIVIGFISICTIGLFGFAFYVNGGRSLRDFVSNGTLLENLYYLMQILVGIGLIVGAVIGVWQYVLTARCQRASISKECIQKAIDLAEYYKNKILPEYSVFNYIYEESGMHDVLKKIPVDGMVDFDNVELNCNLSRDDFEQLLKLMKSEKMATLLKERGKAL